MPRNSFIVKQLRIVGIVLIGMQAVFTLNGGARTTCVSLAVSPLKRLISGTSASSCETGTKPISS